MMFNYVNTHACLCSLHLVCSGITTALRFWMTTLCMYGNIKTLLIWVKTCLSSTSLHSAFKTYWTLLINMLIQDKHQHRFPFCQKMCSELKDRIPKGVNLLHCLFSQKANAGLKEKHLRLAIDACYFCSSSHCEKKKSSLLCGLTCNWTGSINSGFSCKYSCSLLVFPSLLRGVEKCGLLFY